MAFSSIDLPVQICLDICNLAWFARTLNTRLQ